MSLSIVAGIPITGKLFSSLNINPPVNVPSPPITIRPSISFFFKLLNALSLPFLVLKSFDLAVFKIVPPLLIIPLTLLAFISNISPLIKPSKPFKTPNGMIP